MQATGSSLSPRVSVIMPVRNGARFLAEAVTSILTQTETDLELLVVDDGSTDDSAAIAASTGDPRVRVLTGPNKGTASARNRGLEEARGRWVAWQDADDIAVPHRLDTLLSAVAAGADFAHSDMTFIDQSGSTTGYLRSSNVRRDHVLPFMLREGTPYNNPTMLVRRATVSELRFDERFVQGEDTDFVRRFAPHTVGVHVPEPLTWYRRHSTSTSHQATHDALFPHVAHLVDSERLEDLVPEAFREYPDAEATTVACGVVGLCLFRRGFHHAAVTWIERALSGGTTRESAGLVTAMTALASEDAAGVRTALSVLRPTAVVQCLQAEVDARCGDLLTAAATYGRALMTDPLSYDAVTGLRATGGELGLRVVDDPRRRVLHTGEH